MGRKMQGRTDGCFPNNASDKRLWLPYCSHSRSALYDLFYLELHNYQNKNQIRRHSEDSRGFDTTDWDNQFKQVQYDFPKVKFIKI